MIKGCIVNNTGKAKHIFKRTVYPGQRLALDDVYSAVSSRLSEDQPFLEWVQERIPEGWILQLEEDYVEPFEPKSINEPRPGGRTLLASDQEERHLLSGDESDPSLEYASPKTIDKLTARDIFNLRIKDNPKRVIKQVTSVHKLRRSLTLCKNDSRKAMLANIIRHRIKELTG